MVLVQVNTAPVLQQRAFMYALLKPSLMPIAWVSACVHVYGSSWCIKKVFEFASARVSLSVSFCGLRGHPRAHVLEVG